MGLLCALLVISPFRAPALSTTHHAHVCWLREEQTRLHPAGQLLVTLEHWTGPEELQVEPPRARLPLDTVWKLLGIVNLDHLLSDPTVLFKTVGVMIRTAFPEFPWGCPSSWCECACVCDTHQRQMRQLQSTVNVCPLQKISIPTCSLLRYKICS